MNWEVHHKHILEQLHDFRTMSATGKLNETFLINYHFLTGIKLSHGVNVESGKEEDMSAFGPS